MTLANVTVLEHGGGGNGLSSYFISETV